MARRASAEASCEADKAAFRAVYGDYKPARASGTRDDDEAPTLQKELLSVVIRPLVRRHEAQQRRRVAAHEARRPQGPC